MRRFALFPLFAIAALYASSAIVSLAALAIEVLSWPARGVNHLYAGHPRSIFETRRAGLI